MCPFWHAESLCFINGSGIAQRDVKVLQAEVVVKQPLRDSLHGRSELKHDVMNQLLEKGMPAIAQLVEHLTVECCSYQMVPGSIPGGRI